MPHVTGELALGAVSAAAGVVSAVVDVLAASGRRRGPDWADRRSGWLERHRFALLAMAFFTVAAGASALWWVGAGADDDDSLPPLPAFTLQADEPVVTTREPALVLGGTLKPANLYGRTAFVVVQPADDDDGPGSASAPCSLSGSAFSCDRVRLGDTTDPGRAHQLTVILLDPGAEKPAGRLRPGGLPRGVTQIWQHTYRPEPTATGLTKRGSS